MLRGIDALLEIVGWSLVVFFVIMLFAGPQVIAEDKAQPNAADTAGAAPDAETPDAEAPDAGAAPSADGEAVFSVTCGSCHTLSAAGTSGTVGPNLDGVSLDAGAIEGI